MFCMAVTNEMCPGYCIHLVARQSTKRPQGGMIGGDQDEEESEERPARHTRQKRLIIVSPGI